jgi:uncharacterized membrane protein
LPLPRLYLLPNLSAYLKIQEFTSYFLSVVQLQVVMTGEGETLMYSKVKVLGHPVHPMLVPLVIGSYAGALFGYLIFAATGGPFWFHFGYVCNSAGVLMAVAAAIPGFIDWLWGIPRETAAKADGLKHMVLNVTALALFSANLGIYFGQWNTAIPDARFSFVLPLLGVLVSIGAGYLGWTLVQKHHVGILFTKKEEQCILHDIAEVRAHQKKVKRAA